MRPLYLIAGLVMLALGIIGAFVPLMPTTIFLIMAAWCFARSSPRLENWLLNHRQFGPTLRAWREHGAISRRAKIMACLGITLGFVLFWIGARPGLWLWLGVLAVMLACAWFIVSRPEPDGQS
ncbi:membrane protein [Devosia epidermidihirudinis]|uniref:Membrane protein n=2 Tax=Devosia epidermidihirudinis TaxID=1293439 RepID=A0A0F5Q5R6_9HYPH|nr:YbaN family protein [Devosia epidermidihirudinis]KKC35414.1 membrane protein [Devosia epidermidihirudinis]